MSDERTIDLVTLTAGEREMHMAMYDAAVAAIAPNDPTGHVTDCGYTAALPVCGCLRFGRDIWRGLRHAVVARRDNLPGSDES